MLYPYPTNTSFSRMDYEFDNRPPPISPCCNVRHKRDWRLSCEAHFTIDPSSTPCVARTMVEIPIDLHFMSINSGMISICPPQAKYFNKVFKTVVSFGLYIWFDDDYSIVLFDLGERAILEPHEVFLDSYELSCVPMIPGRMLGVEIMYRGSFDSASNYACAEMTLTGSWDRLVTV
jgi:hypothetical protein